jgi:hypothetical protein
MGWLFMYGLDGHSGPKQYLDAQCTYERPTVTSKVLRSSLVRMRVYYAAVEHTFPDGKIDVWAAVCLVKYNPRARDGLIFGYKDQDETMGPCETECPAEILDLLTPTESEWANEWRGRCREFNSLNAANAKKPKLKPGQVVEFDPPIQMTDETVRSKLEFVKPWPRSRKLLFRVPGTGECYTVRNVKHRAYKVLDRNT